jgi:hypothetical protein
MLLLVAAVGAVVLAGRRRDDTDRPTSERGSAGGRAEEAAR